MIIRMTSLLSQPQIEMSGNCCSSFRLPLGWVVEKLLFGDLIPFPPLVRDLLHLGRGAVQPDKVEFPTYDNSVAADEYGSYAFRRHAFRSGENGSFVSNKLVSTSSRFCLIFLH
jgi:hypothetical protein